jgi:hypothetical protein
MLASRLTRALRSSVPRFTQKQRLILHFPKSFTTSTKMAEYKPDSGIPEHESTWPMTLPSPMTCTLMVLSSGLFPKNGYRPPSILVGIPQSPMDGSL